MAEREPPKALRRLEIEIDGIVDTISGKMERFFEWMRASGMSDEAALRRVKLELESGQMLSELRQFASAKVPGFVGDLTFRFARDSVAVAQKDLNAYQEALARITMRSQGSAGAVLTQEERDLLRRFETKKTDKSIRDATGKTQEELLQETNAIREKLGLDSGASLRQAAKELAQMEKEGITQGLPPEESDRLKEIVSAYEKQGVMIEGADSELPEPPPDADLNDEYLWITVHDQRVCEVCAENHNQVRKLGEWSEIGEPRSGACLGDQNCRCILVPADAVSEEDRAALEKPLVIEK